MSQDRERMPERDDDTAHNDNDEGSDARSDALAEDVHELVLEALC